jgi:hypothetical protein
MIIIIINDKAKSPNKKLCFFSVRNKKKAADGIPSTAFD